MYTQLAVLGVDLFDVDVRSRTVNRVLLVRPQVKNEETAKIDSA
jgi:hypothetical protein